MSEELLASQQGFCSVELVVTTLSESGPRRINLRLLCLKRASCYGGGRI
jgi:hypothetical protein